MRYETKVRLYCPRQHRSVGMQDVGPTSYVLQPAGCLLPTSHLPCVIAVRDSAIQLNSTQQITHTRVSECVVS